jgi:NAD(P)-dependent dehydrogenase (short-subunit alcohol dehydrogenase family)
MTTARVITPFGAESTAQEVPAGVDRGGKRGIVTGAWSGIGLETARELARAGAAVHLAVRDVEAGHRAGDDIVTTTGNSHVEVASLDPSDLGSVTRFIVTACNRMRPSPTRLANCGPARTSWSGRRRPKEIS